MKKLLTLILAGFGSICNIEAISIGHQEIPYQIVSHNYQPDNTPIVLYGLLDYGVNQNSIEAFACKNSVQICFHQNFGYVNITLMSETGSVVYNNTVNTAVQQTFYISLSDTSSGNYTLILDNANGYAEDDFAR